MGFTVTEAHTKEGFSLLPSGLRQFNVFRAAPEVNQHTGTRELVVEVGSHEGSGSFTIPLEKPPMMEQDTFEWLFAKQLHNLGVPVVGLDSDQIVANLPNTLRGVVNSIVELEVTHVAGTKLKADGTPYMNARVKVKRVIEPGSSVPQVAPQAQADPGIAAAAAAFPGAEVQTFVATPANTDGLPF